MKKKQWMGCVGGWVLGMAGIVGAQQTYTWAEVYAGGDVPDGLVVSEADGALVVTGTAGTPTTIRLLTIEDPAVEERSYQVSGQVGYQDVEGEAYLEMWNVFSDGSRYFTRTLSDGGPTGKLMGSESPRDFTLPFNRTGASGELVRLEINLVLPGAGEVRFGEMMLGGVKRPMGGAGMGGTWLVVGVCVGGGVLMGLVSMLRRRKGDSAEVRKMNAMDV